jgi:hypothetical protein
MSKPLAFNYDATRDEMTIEGMKYSGQLFRAFAGTDDGVGLSLYTPFIIKRREDGIIEVALLNCKV